MSSEIALFCLAYPASEQKKETVLGNLQNLSRTYYRKAESLCTTWSYFTPSNRKDAFNDIAKRANNANLVAGLEIYTDKSALGAQQKTNEFQQYHEKVKKDGLYAKDEELNAWYPVGGFISKAEEKTEEGGEGRVVVMAIVTTKEGEESQKAFVDGMSAFANWVKDNESETLSYLILTRPKAPNEVMIFERYTNDEGFKQHSTSKAIKDAFGKLTKFMKGMKGQEWREIDESFLGTVAGGPSKKEKQSKL